VDLTDGGLFAESFIGMMRDRDSWCRLCNSLGHSQQYAPLPLLQPRHGKQRQPKGMQPKLQPFVSTTTPKAALARSANTFLYCRGRHPA